MFSDETTWRLFYIRRRIWKRRGQIKVVRTVKHDPKVNVWGYFSASGFGELAKIKGHLDAKKMMEIYEKGLFASADKLFGPDTRNWQFLEDRNPKHTGKLAKAWKAQHKVMVMEWPTQSPDCNPIENVWSVLKKKVGKFKITTTKQLFNEIKREWCKLSTEYAENLAESCFKRCQEVIDNNGDWTSH